MIHVGVELGQASALQHLSESVPSQILQKPLVYHVSGNSLQVDFGVLAPAHVALV